MQDCQHDTQQIPDPSQYICKVKVVKLARKNFVKLNT